MAARKRKPPRVRARARPREPEPLFARARPAKKLPFDFVLEEIADLGPYTKPMFGCHAVYVDERIVFILREKRAGDGDDGVWVATTREHHASLARELPSMRSIGVLGSGVTGWQILPADGDGFEEEVRRACALVLARDPRIGKVPARRRR